MNGVLEFAATIDPRWVLIALLGALDLWAGLLVAFSTAARRDKILWIGILVLCPIVGCLLWFVFGPKWQRTPS